MVFSVILPIIFLLLFGYASVRFKLIDKSQISALSAVVIKVSLPALLFHVLASKDFHEIWHPSYFIVYATVSVFIFALTFCITYKFFKNSFSHSAVLAMGSSMSNTGFIGTAILTLLMGNQATVYISLTLIVENVIVITLLLALAEAGLQKQKQFSILIKQTLLKLIKNPVIISVILGLICAATGIHLPKALDQALEMLGRTASPLALFVIGGGLVGLSIQSVSVQSFILVFLKVLLMPALVFMGLSLMPNTTQDMIYAGTMIAALPMASAFGIFGQYYGLNEKALTPLMMSTFLGFIGVSCLIAIWW